MEPRLSFMSDMLSSNWATLQSRDCWCNVVITALRRQRWGDRKAALLYTV